MDFWVSDSPLYQSVNTARSGDKILGNNREQWNCQRWLDRDRILSGPRFQGGRTGFVNYLFKDFYLSHLVDVFAVFPDILQVRVVDSIKPPGAAIGALDRGDLAPAVGGERHCWPV